MHNNKELRVSVPYVWQHFADNSTVHTEHTLVPACNVASCNKKKIVLQIYDVIVNERMRAYEVGQIPPLWDTGYLNFQNKNKNRFCCEKWVVGDLNYTKLDSYI
jgi:hypothetical protein